MVTGQTASMEDYLETIAMLSAQRRVVRVSHISRALRVSMSSVTSALKRLAEDGLVIHEPYGYIELTVEGEKIAHDVFHMHEALRRFLTGILGVEPDVANEDACKMEHAVSRSTRNRLSKFVEFALTNPQGHPEWLDHFSYYYIHGKRPQECHARRSGEE